MPLSYRRAWAHQDPVTQSATESSQCSMMSRSTQIHPPARNGSVPEASRVAPVARRQAPAVRRLPWRRPGLRQRGLGRKGWPVRWRRRESAGPSGSWPEGLPTPARCRCLPRPPHGVLLAVRAGGEAERNAPCQAPSRGQMSLLVRPNLAVGLRQFGQNGAFFSRQPVGAFRLRAGARAGRTGGPLGRLGSLLLRLSSRPRPTRSRIWLTRRRRQERGSRARYGRDHGRTVFQQSHRQPAVSDERNPPRSENPRREMEGRDRSQHAVPAPPTVPGCSVSPSYTRK